MGLKSLEFTTDVANRLNMRLPGSATAQTQHQVKSGLLLNVVVRQRAAVLQLLPSEDQALLVWRDAFLVLDLRLHVVDGVARLHIQCDGLSRQRLDEDLHAA